MSFSSICPSIILASMVISLSAAQTIANQPYRDYLRPGSSALCPSLLEDTNSQRASLAERDGAFASDRITYFENLSEYSPMNSHGSCGFVSLIQYMSYYDTFWNDNIIPDAYERCDESATTMASALATSPGVCRREYPNAGMSLYLFCSQTEDDNFQSRCMMEHNRAKQISNPLFSCSIGMWDYQEVFDRLYGSGQATFSYVSYESISSDPTDPVCQNTLRQRTISYLNLGKPVILHIGYWKADESKISNYHSLVAYDYSDGKIWCNYGWSDAWTHSDLGDYLIFQVGLANFDSWEHVHSYNYTVNGIKYCPCGAHEHVYNDHYVSMNPYYHYEYCWCGAYTVHSHAMVLNDGGTGYHCRYCSYAE